MSAVDFKKILFLRDSKSQLGQDIFALFTSNFKTGGTFLEIGAADGITLSNSYILEKYFGWTGVLCEPAIGWHSDLRANRTAELIFDAVWSSSNLLLEFREVSQKEFSTFREFSDKDQHAKLRSEGFDYSVKTISLPDLIRKCNIPEKLDYLSLDTEGSEFEIIRDVDFETFRPKVITVEHNFTSNRQKIFDLLTSFGYKRCYEELSRWDDWYTI